MLSAPDDAEVLAELSDDLYEQAKIMGAEALLLYLEDTLRMRFLSPNGVPFPWMAMLRLSLTSSSVSTRTHNARHFRLRRRQLRKTTTQEGNSRAPGHGHAYRNGYSAPHAQRPDHAVW